MNALFSPKPADTPVDDPGLSGAYQKGRHDAQADVNVKAFEKARENAVRNAYDRGRRDERARRHGSPLLTFLLLIAAAGGAFVIYLAVQEGSFSRGGQVVDQGVSGAAAATTHATHDVASKAGNALENAGARLKGDADTNS